MKRYLINSAVITASGVYRYHLVTRTEARAWASAAPWVSTIGYEQTAEALSEIIGTPVPVSRVAIAMVPGDEALVFRLVFPAGTPRIDPADKGRLRAEVLAGNYELGILTRIE